MGESSMRMSETTVRRVSADIAAGIARWSAVRAPDRGSVPPVPAGITVATRTQRPVTLSGKGFVVSAGVLELIADLAERDVSGPPERPAYRARVLGLLVAHEFVCSSGFDAEAAVVEAAWIIERSPELGRIADVPVPMSVIECRGLREIRGLAPDPRDRAS